MKLKITAFGLFTKGITFYKTEIWWYTGAHRKETHTHTTYWS